MFKHICKVFLEILYAIGFARSNHVSFMRALRFIKADSIIQKEIKNKAHIDQ